MQRAAEAGDRPLFTRLDLSFHERLCLLSKNGRLHKVFRSYASILGLLFRLEVDTIYTSQASLAVLYAEHERLFEEISSLDVRRAERACDRHLEFARGRLVEEFGRALLAADAGEEAGS